MAARHEPVGALATSCAPPTNPVDDHQAVSTPVDQGYQELSSNSGVPTRTARPEEPRSSTWMQQLGGLVQSCVGYVQQFFRQFIQPARLAGSGPKECITNIDPNTQQIVSNEFIEQVSRDHAELFNLRNERDKIRERWQAAVSELNDLKPSEQIFVVDDAEMTGKWKQLQYSIKNFARSHLWEPISSEKLIIQQRECLELITPRYQELLSSEKHVHLLFQSFIWLNIMNLTLADTTLMWGKQVAEAYRGLAKYRPESKEDHHSWRASTAKRLQHAKGVDAVFEKCVKRTLYAAVAGFISYEQICDIGHATIIRRNLDGIADKAIELAIIFNQSRCVYDVMDVDHGDNFDPATMEYGDDCDAPQVEMMISPVLVKDGNSRGQDYDRRLVLAKSHVFPLQRDA